MPYHFENAMLTQHTLNYACNDLRNINIAIHCVNNQYSTLALVSLILTGLETRKVGPEEVQHAHVSIYHLYREAFSVGLVPNSCANRKLSLY